MTNIKTRQKSCNRLMMVGVVLLPNLTILKLSDVASVMFTVTMFLIVDLKTACYTEFEGCVWSVSAAK
jgi:hypothetical protein